MPMNTEVLAIILGGGQGSRLFPLTHHRSKPAVPIGGSYRLIDIPISNYLHADIRRIFGLTQFNSASLNRHISPAFHLDQFSQGLVDILAAGQTPDNPNWYQGTADAVRHAARPFVRYDMLDAMNQDGATDFGGQIIPAARGKYKVHAYLLRGYWADDGTVSSYYDANIMLTRPGSPFRFYDPRRPIFTHARFLPGARFSDCHVRDAIVAEGCYVDRASIEESIVGIRTNIQSGAAVRRSLLLGADYYEADDEVPARGDNP